MEHWKISASHCKDLPCFKISIDNCLKIVFASLHLPLPLEGNSLCPPTVRASDSLILVRRVPYAGGSCAYSALLFARAARRRSEKTIF